MQRLLVDSGPLVALFDADDRWHRPVADFLKKYRGELVTSAANVTEAAWITASASDRMLANLLTWLHRGGVSVHNLEPQDFSRIAALFAQYRTLRPDFADLALVALAERLKLDRILTLDKKDFMVYRLKNGQPLRNVLDAEPAKR
ncbi:MAG: PIN domain-containing protein [Betaproteobacteria bacterium]|nr:PIN domain-containing protein [Betaproteobacteria bacterium]